MLNARANVIAENIKRAALRQMPLNVFARAS